MLPCTDLIVPSTFCPIVSDFRSILGWAGSVFICAIAPATPSDAVKSAATTTARARVIRPLPHAAWHVMLGDQAQRRARPVPPNMVDVRNRSASRGGHFV